MRKIGVISDVHGNLTALKAVLELLEKEGCEEIIHTGDVVDIGPESRACLELLLSRQDVTCLLGNHDRDFLLNQTQARHLSHVPSVHKQQVFATLNDELRQRVGQMPVYVTRNCGGSKLLFCHYAFKKDSPCIKWESQAITDGITNLSPSCLAGELFKPLVSPHSAEAFDEMFEGFDCDAVFFGHKHEPCDIMSERLYVDVGSVGCHPEPKARAVVIEYDDNGWSYKRVYAPYDMEATRNAMHDIACGEQLYDFYFLLRPNVGELG